MRADFSTGAALGSLTPVRVGNAAPAVLELRGAGFDPSAKVDLRSGASVVAAGEPAWIAADRLRADFNLTQVPAGSYQVTLTQGTNTVSLPIEIVAGGSPHLETRLIVPSRVGRHAPGTLMVEYGNSGDVAMRAPLLIVHGSDHALLTLDPSLSARGFWTAARPRGFSDTVQILASGETPGILQAACAGVLCRAASAMGFQPACR